MFDSGTFGKATLICKQTPASRPLQDPCKQTPASGSCSLSPEKTVTSACYSGGNTSSNGGKLGRQVLTQTNVPHIWQGWDNCDFGNQQTKLFPQNQTDMDDFCSLPIWKAPSQWPMNFSVV